ncbi:MAG: SCO family protein [Deltaproteobacteria bacterium]|nr:SCO family protein [Deltaproteobacteria bacterium]
MSKGFFGTVSWVAALLLGAHGFAASHDPKPSVLGKGAPRRQVHIPIGDFSLTDHEGKAFAFAALKGKLVLVSFIYTSCPDVCPLITSSMRTVQRGLNGRERKSVHFLSITTDPEIDSPEILKSYARRYEVDFSNWSFLTGDIKALQPVWKAFGVKVERKARGLVNHTALTALIDAGGVMRFAYYGAAPDHRVVLQDIRNLLSPHRK